MNVALKEWAVVISAMKRGAHQILLRKGGLADKGQQFKMEQERFLMFPTYEHQEDKMIALPYRGLLADALAGQPAEDQLKIDCWAKVTESTVVKSFEDLMSMESGHIWSEEYLRMRWNYKPEKLLYKIKLEVYPFKESLTVPNLKRYGGCRSWVQMEQDIPIENSPS